MEREKPWIAQAVIWQKKKNKKTEEMLELSYKMATISLAPGYEIAYLYFELAAYCCSQEGTVYNRENFNFRPIKIFRVGEKKKNENRCN